MRARCGRMELDARACEELAAWLRLTLTPGLGPAGVRALLAVHGLPQQVLEQPGAVLASQVGAACAQALLTQNALREAAVARTLDWAAGADCHLLTLADRAYPPLLLQSADPPAVLYVRGDPQRLSRPMLAIVGSRNATRGGCDAAARFAGTLAEAGLTVVSGLARGIDAAAHAGALGHPAGTIAVMATGIDRCYPPEHAALAERIAACGALLTEAPVGAVARRSSFPRRNRIIAALAHGVLVIEAARASGSLITARIAAELGREVFAMPGSIHSPLSKGCHQLIQQGAKLVESAHDVLTELPATPSAPGLGLRPAAAPPRRRLRERPGVRGGSAPLPPADDALLQLLGFDPVHPDALVAPSALAPGELAERLLALELDGCIERLADGRCLRRR